MATSSSPVISSAAAVPVVDDEPRLLPPEVEVELEGDGERDVVDLAHLEHEYVDVDVQRLAVGRRHEVLRWAHPTERRCRPIGPTLILQLG